ncbi:MAG: hypothetical protein ACFCBW_04930 [Candidatus Competibacterales bacterium]
MPPPTSRALGLGFLLLWALVVGRGLQTLHALTHLQDHLQAHFHQRLHALQAQFSGRPHLHSHDPVNPCPDQHSDAALCPLCLATVNLDHFLLPSNPAVGLCPALAVTVVKAMGTPFAEPRVSYRIRAPPHGPMVSMVFPLVSPSL